ncbi:hypothetical protein DF3PB_600020 [uncultured Defluviicoccus sp.]|uniref:Uncharacterized protein n=1 Tax=metagenome TaxID=256318 RepID=A0A380TIT5_9ZZZZ|nr:hypothetical protein DF3PB_600020 [uncultured Defluviicoccus sp.]
MNVDLITRIPDLSQLVTLPAVLDLYHAQFGEELPYTTLYSAAHRRNVPAYRFGNRIVFQKSDLPTVLTRMNIRARRPANADAQA